MTKQNDYLTKIKRLYELKETLKKLDKEYTKKINDLESDLAKDEQLLKAPSLIESIVFSMITLLNPVQSLKANELIITPSPP